MLGVSIKMVKNKKGFTLIELLIVMAILGILSVIGLGQFRNSQRRARDAARKADMENISRALQLYYVDNNEFPISTNGKITVDDSSLTWGEGSFSMQKDGDTIVYMSLLPSDPTDDSEYCYSYDSSTNKYFLYSLLENGSDPDILSCVDPENGIWLNCSGRVYNYVVSSTNANPNEACP